jgi:hypothetical protein
MANICERNCSACGYVESARGVSARVRRIASRTPIERRRAFSMTERMTADSVATLGAQAVGAPSTYALGQDHMHGAGPVLLLSWFAFQFKAPFFKPGFQDTGRPSGHLAATSSKHRRLSRFVNASPIPSCKRRRAGIERLLRCNTAQRREFYEDRDVRISVLARPMVLRPDTLSQQNHLQTGRAIRFLRSPARRGHWDFYHRIAGTFSRPAQEAALQV